MFVTDADETDLVHQEWVRGKGGIREGAYRAMPASQRAWGRGSLKSHHLRAMAKASYGDLRRIMAELGASDISLNREELVRAGSRLAVRGALALSWQCVTEMSKRGMRPSLNLNNALMAAYGRTGRWDMAMTLLLRMQQEGLQPNESTFVGAIRAGSRAPGGSQFAELLRPQLEAAARREAESMGLAIPESSSTPLSTRTVTALVSAEGFDSESEATGLKLLLGKIAEGTPPDARMYLVALASCASASGRWQEAMQITSMMELWVREDRAPRQRSAREYIEFPRAQLSEVGSAYAAAIAACDESEVKEEALGLLTRMESLGVPPRVEAYNAAISACRHDSDLNTAQALLSRMRKTLIGPDTTSYNALLAVVRSKGGMGEEALRLLKQMQREGHRPDEITYLEVITACRPTSKEARVFKAAAYERQRLASGKGARRPRAVTDAIISDAAVELAAGTPSAEGPSVALVAVNGFGGGSSSSDAIAAPPERLWSDGVPLWRRGLDLLGEMQLRGLQRNQHHYGAAIEVCHRIGDVEEAMRLLMQMPGLGLQPDRYCLIPALQAAANAGDYQLALRIVNEAEAAVARSEALVAGDDAASHYGHAPLMGRGGLGLFDAEGATGPDMGGTTRSHLHETALIAGGTGLAPLPMTLAILPLMRERGIPHTRFGYTSAIHACKRSNAWREAIGVLKAERAAGLPPTAANLARTLRLFKDSGERSGIGPPWAATIALLDEAAKHSLVLPAESRSHVLSVGRIAGVGWDAVRQTERVDFEPADSSAGLDSRSSGPRAKTPVTLEVQLQGELFCLAAQDGMESERLQTLMWRLKRAGSAPTPRLLERALHACRAGREEREGWRHVPALLDLAKREKVRLSEQAFVHVLHAYPPIEGQQDIGSGSRRTLSPRAINTLAEALRVDALSERSLHLLLRLCGRLPAAASHARLLVGQLHEVALPRTARVRGAKSVDRSLDGPPRTARSDVAGASRRQFPQPVDGSHLPSPMVDPSRQTGFPGVDRINGSDAVNGIHSPHVSLSVGAQPVDDEQVTLADDESITPQAGAAICTLIGRVAAHEGLATTARERRQAPPRP